MLTISCATLALSAAAQSTDVVRETQVEQAMANGSPGLSNTGAISVATVPVTPVAQVKKTLAQPNAVLLDVRTPEEYATGHLPGAGNLDFRAPNVAVQLQQLDPNKTYVVYCASGNRSNKTALLMQEKGFKHVVNAGAYKDLKDDIK